MPLALLAEKASWGGPSADSSLDGDSLLSSGNSLAKRAICSLGIAKNASVQFNEPLARDNAGADVANSETAAMEIGSGKDVQEVAPSDPSTTACDTSCRPRSSSPQRNHSETTDAICPSGIISETTHSPCSDKIEKSTVGVDGVLPSRPRRVAIRRAEKLRGHPSVPGLQLERAPRLRMGQH